MYRYYLLLPELRTATSRVMESKLSATRTTWSDDHKLTHSSGFRAPQVTTSYCKCGETNSYPLPNIILYYK